MDDRYGLRALFSFGIEGNSLNSMNMVRGSLGAILKAVQELDRTSGSTAERIGRQMGDMGRSASRGTERVASSVEKASSASREASAGLKGLKAEFRALKAESRNIDFGDLTDDAGFKSATTEVHRYVNALKELESQIKSDSVAEREFAATLKSAQRAGTGKADVADQQRKAAIAADRLGKAQALKSAGWSTIGMVAEPLEAAKELQQQMGTIQKLAGGITDRGMVQVQTAIMNFSSDMAIADAQVASVLEDLAGAGKDFRDEMNNQTGKRYIDERMAEVQQILKNKSALDVTTDAATQLNITLGSIYKDSLSNYNGGIVELNARAASAINELTDKLENVKISAQDVIPTMTVVMNTIGDAKNFPIEQIAAFSAGISSLGTIEPEAAGSFFNRLGASMSDNISGFATALKMSEEEFDKAINTDKLGVVLKIAETYKTMEGGELVKGAFLKSIGIASAQDQKLIQGVANNIAVFNDARKVASKGFLGESGKDLSVAAEFARVTQTSAFKAEQFNQSVKALKDTIGLALAEALLPLWDIATKILRTVLTLTQQFPGLTKAIAVGITLFGTFAVAVGTAAAVLFTYQQAAATASIASISMARGLLPMTGFFQTAMGAFTATNPLVGAMTMIKQLVVPLAAPLTSIATIIEGIGVTITAAVLSPLGLAIAGLTSLYLILEAATPELSLLGTVLSALAVPFGFIVGFVNGLAGGFLGGLKSAFSPLGNALSFPFHAMNEALKTAIASFTLFANKGEELGKAVGSAIANPLVWASTQITNLWKGMLGKIAAALKPLSDVMRMTGYLFVALLATNPTDRIPKAWQGAVGMIGSYLTGLPIIGGLIGQQMINALNHNPTERIPEAWFGAVGLISDYLMGLPIIGSLVSGELIKSFDPAKILEGFSGGGFINIFEQTGKTITDTLSSVSKIFQNQDLKDQRDAALGYLEIMWRTVDPVRVLGDNLGRLKDSFMAIPLVAGFFGLFTSEVNLANSAIAQVRSTASNAIAEFRKFALLVSDALGHTETSSESLRELRRQVVTVWDSLTHFLSDTANQLQKNLNFFTTILLIISTMPLGLISKGFGFSLIKFLPGSLIADDLRKQIPNAFNSIAGALPLIVAYAISKGWFKGIEDGIASTHAWIKRTAMDIAIAFGGDPGKVEKFFDRMGQAVQELGTVFQSFFGFLKGTKIFDFLQAELIFQAVGALLGLRQVGVIAPILSVLGTVLEGLFTVLTSILSFNFQILFAPLYLFSVLATSIFKTFSQATAAPIEQAVSAARSAGSAVRAESEVVFTAARNSTTSFLDWARSSLGKTKIGEKFLLPLLDGIASFARTAGTVLGNFKNTLIDTFPKGMILGTIKNLASGIGKIFGTIFFAIADAFAFGITGILNFLPRASEIVGKYFSTRGWLDLGVKAITPIDAIFAIFSKGSQNTIVAKIRALTGSMAVMGASMNDVIAGLTWLDKIRIFGPVVLQLVGALGLLIAALYIIGRSFGVLDSLVGVVDFTANAIRKFVSVAKSMSFILHGLASDSYEFAIALRTLNEEGIAVIAKGFGVEEWAVRSLGFLSRFGAVLHPIAVLIEGLDQGFKNLFTTITTYLGYAMLGLIAFFTIMSRGNVFKGVEKAFGFIGKAIGKLISGIQNLIPAFNLLKLSMSEGGRKGEEFQIKLDEMRLSASKDSKSFFAKIAPFFKIPLVPEYDKKRVQEQLPRRQELQQFEKQIEETAITSLRARGIVKAKKGAFGRRSYSEAQIAESRQQVYQDPEMLRAVAYQSGIKELQFLAEKNQVAALQSLKDESGRQKYLDTGKLIDRRMMIEADNVDLHAERLNANIGKQNTPGTSTPKANRQFFEVGEAASLMEVDRNKMNAEPYSLKVAPFPTKSVREAFSDQNFNLADVLNSIKMDKDAAKFPIKQLQTDESLLRYLRENYSISAAIGAIREGIITDISKQRVEEILGVNLAQVSPSTNIQSVNNDPVKKVRKGRQVDNFRKKILIDVIALQGGGALDEDALTLSDSSALENIYRGSKDGDSAMKEALTKINKALIPGEQDLYNMKSGDLQNIAETLQVKMEPSEDKSETVRKVLKNQVRFGQTLKMLSSDVNQQPVENPIDVGEMNLDLPSTTYEQRRFGFNKENVKGVSIEDLRAKRRDILSEAGYKQQADPRRLAALKAEQQVLKELKGSSNLSAFVNNIKDNSRQYAQDLGIGLGQGDDDNKIADRILRRLAPSLSILSPEKDTTALHKQMSKTSVKQLDKRLEQVAAEAVGGIEGVIAAAIKKEGNEDSTMLANRRKEAVKAIKTGRLEELSAKELYQLSRSLNLSVVEMMQPGIKAVRDLTKEEQLRANVLRRSLVSERLREKGIETQSAFINQVYKKLNKDHPDLGYSTDSIQAEFGKLMRGGRIKDINILREFSEVLNTVGRTGENAIVQLEAEIAAQTLLSKEMKKNVSWRERLFGASGGQSIGKDFEDSRGKAIQAIEEQAKQEISANKQLQKVRQKALEAMTFIATGGKEIPTLDTYKTMNIPSDALIAGRTEKFTPNDWDAIAKKLNVSVDQLKNIEGFKPNPAIAAQMEKVREEELFRSAEELRRRRMTPEMRDVEDKRIQMTQLRRQQALMSNATNLSAPPGGLSKEEAIAAQFQEMRQNLHASTGAELDLIDRLIRGQINSTTALTTAEKHYVSKIAEFAKITERDVLALEKMPLTASGRAVRSVVTAIPRAIGKVRSVYNNYEKEKSFTLQSLMESSGFTNFTDLSETMKGEGLSAEEVGGFLQGPRAVAEVTRERRGVAEKAILTHLKKMKVGTSKKDRVGIIASSTATELENLLVKGGLGIDEAKRTALEAKLTPPTLEEMLGGRKNLTKVAALFGVENADEFQQRYATQEAGGFGFSGYLARKGLGIGKEKAIQAGQGLLGGAKRVGRKGLNLGGVAIREILAESLVRVGAKPLIESLAANAQEETHKIADRVNKMRGYVPGAGMLEDALRKVGGWFGAQSAQIVGRIDNLPTFSERMEQFSNAVVEKYNSILEAVKKSADKVKSWVPTPLKSFLKGAWKLTFGALINAGKAAIAATQIAIANGTRRNTPTPPPAATPVAPPSTTPTNAPVRVLITPPPAPVDPPGALAVSYSVAAKAFARQIETIGKRMGMNYGAKAGSIPKVVVPRPQAIAPGQRQFHDEEITPVQAIALQKLAALSKRVASKVAGAFQESAAKSELAYFHTSANIANRAWKGLVVRAYTVGKQILARIAENSPGPTAQIRDKYDQTSVAVAGNMHDMAQAAGTAGHQIEQSITHSATKSQGLLTHLAKGFGSVTKAGMAVGGAIAATGFAAQTVAFSLGNMGLVDEETTQALSKFMEIFTLVGAIGGLAAPIIGAIGASLGAVVTIGGAVIAAIVGIGTAVGAFIISPFGLASIAAVGAILAINEGMKRYLGIDALGAILTPAMEFARSLFNQVSTELVGAVTWVEGAWQGMAERFYPILQPVVQPALDTAQQLINALNHNPTERIPEAWLGAVGLIGDYLMHLPIIGSLVSGDLVKVFDPGRIFGGIFEGAANLIAGLEKSGLGKLMGGQLQSLKNFFGGTKAPTPAKEETVAPVVLDYQNEFKNAIALAKAEGDQKAIAGLAAYKEATGGQITPEQYAGIFSTEGIGGDYLAKSVAIANAKAKESRELEAVKTIANLSSSGEEKLAATKGLRQELFGNNLLMREPGDRRRALQAELAATNAELEKLTGGKSAINLFAFNKEDRDKIEKIADKAYRIAQEYQPSVLGGSARGFLDAIGIDPDGAEAAISGISQSLGNLTNEWSDRWRYLERNGTGDIGEMISPGIEQAKSGFAILGIGAKTFASEASGALMRLDFKALAASAASFGSTLGFGLGQIVEGFKSASLSAVVFGLFSLVALNPVALVVLGIGVAAVAIATNFLGVRTILVGVFKTIVGIVKTISATISFVGRLATAVGTIFQGLRMGDLSMVQIGMKNVFESMEVYVNRVRVAFKDLVEGGFGLATGAIEGLGQVARNVLGFLGVSPEAVSGAFNRVAGAISWVKQGLISLITRPQMAWQKLKDLLDKIAQKVENIVGRVSSTPGQVAGAVKSRFVNNPNTTQNPEVKPKKDGMMSRLGGILGRKNEAAVMKADIPKSVNAAPPPKSIPEAAVAAAEAVEDSTNNAVNSARNALSSLSSALSTFSPSLAAPLIMFSSLMDAAFSFGETIPAVRSLATAITAQGGIVAAVNAMMATTYGALSAAATTAWTAITGPLLPFVAIAAVVIGVVGGIYLAFKNNFLGIKDLVTGVIDGFKMFFGLLTGGAWDVIAGIFIAIDTEVRAIVGAFFGIGAAIMEAFEPVTSLFGIKGGGGVSLGGAITATVNAILLPLRVVTTAIIFVIRAVSMVIQGLLKVSAIIAGVLLSPIKLIVNYFTFVWNTIRAIASFVTTVWTTVFGGIAQILLNTIMVPFRAIWGAIQSGLNFLRGVPILGAILGAVTAPVTPPTPTGYATGGYVSGIGSTTGDRIPAMLSNGEFVVNAQSTGRNLGFLEAINNGATASEALSLLPTAPRPLPSPPSRSAGSSDAVARGEDNPTIKIELSVGEIHLHGSPEESAREFLNLIGPEMERMVLEAMRQRLEFIR